jgi:hypothetical protein
MKRAVYEVDIKFKNGRDFSFRFESEVGLRDRILKQWSMMKKDGLLPIANYFFNVEEILWMGIEGVDKIEESGGK